jgi:hypothetical protein
MDGKIISEAIVGVTAKWTKQKLAEERKRRIAANRKQYLCPSIRTTWIEAAEHAMPDAYMKASTNNKYPAFSRQVMYAARDPMQEEVGEFLDDKYFCKKLLPDYLYDHPSKTADWDVVFDARGHYEEPHTRVIVPLGTLDVRKYERNVRDAEKVVKEMGLADASERLGLELTSRILPFMTLGPSNRIAAVLFIEKEGFMPLFRAARLADQYDLSIMSSKGLSVVAARRLIDFLCGEFKLPLLVMHDLDQNGFCILGTATRNSRRYKFQNKIDVRDMGLRAKDVERYGLKPEATSLRGNYPEPNLRLNGATEADIRFLLRQQRVELNTFASGDLLTFMKDKFKELGIQKVVPDQDTLTLAYRGISARLLMEQKIEEIRPQIITQADALVVPEDLAARVRKLQRKDSALPWDRAVEVIAKELSCRPM